MIRLPFCLSRFTLMLTCLSGLLGLSGCGDLPRPFMGHPGQTAMKLAAPPPARLAVPTPGNALLDDDSSKLFATSIAHALDDHTVPAVAGPVKKGDWWLGITATTQGNTVVPHYEVFDPMGKSHGKADGQSMPASVWAAGDRPMLKQEALTSADKISDLLNDVDAAMKQSDPNSLFNRPARVAVLDGIGAPGDGNMALSMQMKLALPKIGITIASDESAQTAPADFTVQPRVRTAPGANGSERIEIQWIVTDGSGQESGRTIQINEIPPGTLDLHWGDVAYVASTEAAGGIKQVIQNATGLNRAKAAAGKTADKPAGTASSTALSAPPDALQKAPVSPRSPLP
ncbi:hypothetical protein [Granulibacter bethesdensis]|uniref:hypothetical protein n=1 Tax=Granulibacter bethesdensis TaxID=364410 RepID=UPI0003F20F25|nr:hypothetical protein [Granulibacter bethesdensis]AHJ65195.1 Hypothetical protein GbCGDNIH4_2313 [Granulibacter bethesdensis CGDNIH4]